LLVTDPTGLYDFVRSFLAISGSEGSLIRSAGLIAGSRFYQQWSDVYGGAAGLTRGWAPDISYSYETFSNRCYDIAVLEIEMAHDEVYNWSGNILQNSTGQQEEAVNWVAQHPELESTYNALQMWGWLVTVGHSGANYIKSVTSSFPNPEDIDKSVGRLISAYGLLSSVFLSSNSPLQDGQDLTCRVYNTSSIATSAGAEYSGVLPNSLELQHVSQTIHYSTTPTALDLNWKPPSKPFIPERYEPKFRIINKTNAKDLRR
jgi:hypothetical protein